MASAAGADPGAAGLFAADKQVGRDLAGQVWSLIDAGCRGRGQGQPHPFWGRFFRIIQNGSG